MRLGESVSSFDMRERTASNSSRNLWVVLDKMASSYPSFNTNKDAANSAYLLVIL